MTQLSINNKERGFTIVELLVVIVVIGILAAITIVSYTGITTRANASANKQNASSIISAAEALKGDTTGLYPAPISTPATMVSNINTSNTAKVPSGISVTGQYTAQAAQTPAVVMPTSSNGAIVYVTNNATLASVTGICVYYYDNQNSVIASMTSGTATAASNPANAAAATCS